MKKPQVLQHSPFSYAWVFVFLVGIVGSIALLLTHAATPAISLEAETSTLSSSASAVNDASASGGAHVAFGSGANVNQPSGEAPPGQMSGYMNVCTEDFTKPAALGSWGTNSATTVVYQDGCSWYEYPDGWPSTYTGGAAGYAPAQVLSVHDGMLDYFLHPINGHAQGANPSPVLAGGSQYQTYGKYIMRMKTDLIAGYHDAILLWPQNDGDWQFAESDYPEMDLNASDVNAFAHYGGSGQQDAFSTALDVTQWHTYEQDWTPTSRSYYVDGRLIGTTTNQIFSQPERWQLQTEPSGAAAGGTGHQYIDWVAVYKMN